MSLLVPQHQEMKSSSSSQMMAVMAYQREDIVVGIEASGTWIWGGEHDVWLNRRLACVILQFIVSHFLSLDHVVLN